MKLYIFRTVPLSNIRSLFTAHSAMVYVRQLSSRSICSCSKAVYKPVWHIPLLSVQWINSWCWTEELSERCRISCQNKFVKLVHLVGFIIKKSDHEFWIKPKSVQWINSWCWTEELSERCRVSCQNKFVKLVNLIGFIIKKFVTMHGHMNLKSIIRHKNTVYVAYHNRKSHITRCWHPTLNNSRHRGFKQNYVIF